MKTLMPDDCPHHRWCSAKRTGPHSAECPTELFKLSDGDVDAFCARHAREESYVSGARILRGIYDGRVASSSVYGSGRLDREARRWLAEELLMHERLGTVV